MYILNKHILGGLTLLFCTFLFQEGFSQGIRKVVIDAGHGGHDPGCHGVKSKEKEVCLSMALKLGALIKENCPEVQVVFTRSTDVFVELHERANIANKSKADLFICIHANAGQKAAYGSETYVMGLHKTADNLSVAKRENAVILMEDNYNATYEGFNPNSDEDIIALTLMQSTYLDQSVDIASKIQNNFEKIGRKNRGVKQAGFLVLYKTAMPAILIETGFLTHAEEEAFLASEENQKKMAQAMFQSFKQYKEGIEKRGKNTITKPEEKPAKKLEVKPEIKVNEVQKDSIEKNTVEVSPLKGTPIAKYKKEDSLATVAPLSTKKDTIHIAPKLVKDSAKSVLVNTSAITKERIGVLPERDSIKNTNTSLEKTSLNPQEKQIKAESTAVEKNAGVVFRVQIKSSPKKIDASSTEFKGLQNIYHYIDKDKMYKYTVGESDHPEELIYLQSSLRKKGFTDAFIIALKNNQRIPMEEAKKELKNKL